jgi:hypothetical protein
MADTIASPPDSVYDSYEEAYSALKSHGIEHGYGFVLKQSKPHNSDIRTRYYFQCDRFRDYQSIATTLSTSTRGSGCPFKLTIFQIKNSSQWVLTVTDSNHNHERSLNPSAHNVYRRRTQEQKDIIQLMTHAGARPMQIMAAIQKEDPDTLVSATDVRSDRKAIREEQLNGRTPIETLLDDLSTPEWVFALKKDNDNRVERLFFAHQKQIELLLANPDVILMDCTYRTNKYKLPLLHILGCTNLQTFFSVGFCFLRNETEGDYYWALSNFLLKTEAPQPRVFISDHELALKHAARNLFPGVPQLLCVWHINMNVQTKAQVVWRDANGKTREEKQEIAKTRAQFMKRWKLVVYAKTAQEFQLQWSLLLTDYRHQPELCHYLRNNQYHTRTEWAAAWTSEHRHFETITSSPVEGMHKVLKDYLQTSRGDLLRVATRIKQMVQSQSNKYQKGLASARYTTKFNHTLKAMPFLPEGIHSLLTPVAIERIRQQGLLIEEHQRDPRNRRLCSGFFQKKNGLPCYHTLQNFIRAKSTVPLNYPFDNHWRYQRQQGRSMPLPLRQFETVLEPLTAQTRRPLRRDEGSTRRDPSAFERRVPSTKSQGQSVNINTSVNMSTPTSGPVTTVVSMSIPAPAPNPVSSASPLRSSSPLSITVSVSRHSTPPHVASPASITVSVNMDQSPERDVLPEVPPDPLTVTEQPISEAFHDFWPRIDAIRSNLEVIKAFGERNPVQSTRTSPRKSPLQPVSQLAWQPPSLEEFIADVERRQSQTPLSNYSDMWAVTGFIENTGQGKDPMELVLARQMALETNGTFASCTPTMAWNYYFGEMAAFQAERHAQVRARDPFTRLQELARQRPKRAAAVAASDAWKGLSPRKRRRR